MPNDTYTLTISDAGVTTPSAHASTHVTGGSDAIQSATTGQNGLMTSSQVTSLEAAYTFANGTLNVTSGKLAADSVTTAKIAANNVTLTKLATVPADSILANSGNATGNVSTITCTAAGRAILDDADAAAQRTTLGLGTLATQNANATAITGGTIAGADITLTGKTLTGGNITGANITLTGKTLTGGTLDGVILTNVTGAATSNHASAHITGGSDAIQSATTSQNGLMTSAQVTSLVTAESFANGTLNVTSGKLAADSVTTTKIAANNVTLTKLATVPADSILANSGSTTGNVSTITCTAAGRALLDDANATAQRTTLGLGTLATQNSSNVTITGGTLDGVVLTNVVGGGTNVSTATGILSTTNGGTGFDSYAVGDIVFANTTTSLAKLAATTTGNALISGGNATAPSYGKIGLTTHVSGTLPVANGGTNMTSYAVGDIVYANTTSSLTSLAATTTGNALISGGNATAPSYGKIGLTTHVSGILSVDNGGTGSSTFPAANVTTATGILPIANGGTGKTSFASTGPLYYDSGNQSISVGVAGTLPIASGGTGVTSLAAGFIKSDGTTLTSSAAPISIADGGTGKSSFASTGPLYYNSGNQSISVGVVGTLPIASGGTGVTSLAAGFVKSNGTTLTSSATPISIADGGTGATSLATGFVKSNGTTLTSSAAPISIADGGTGKSSFAGTGPLYYNSGNQSISVGVSGTLPIASGGTGATVLDAGFIKSDGYTLVSSALPISVADGGTGRDRNLTTNALILSGYSTTTPHQLMANGGYGQVLRSSGTAIPAWIDLATSDIISGTFSTSRGGTGLSTFTTNGALYATSTSTLVTGTLPIESGGTGRTNLTSGGALFSNLSGTAINCATLPVSGGGTGLTSFQSGGAIYASGNALLTSGTLPVTAGGTGINGFTPNGAVYCSSIGVLTSGTLPVVSGGTGYQHSAFGVTAITTDIALTASAVGTYTVIAASGTTATLNVNVTNGTTNTLALKSIVPVTRDFRISGSVEMSVAAVNITGTPTYASNIVTVTVTGGHGIPAGSVRAPAFISGITFTGDNYNGLNFVTYVSSTQFTFPVVNVTAIASVSSPQVLIGNAVGVRLSAGPVGSNLPIANSECRGYFFPDAGTAGVVNIPFDYVVNLPSNWEVSVHVANHSTTNSITVKRAKLIATALI